MRGSRTLLWTTLLALALAGCDRPAPLPVPVAKPAPAKPVAGPDRASLLAELRPWLTRHDDAPKKLTRVPCPDDAIQREAPSPEERVVALRAQDSRWEKRSLLPLRVTQELCSVDAPSLETRLIARKKPVDPSVAAQVEWLSKRRYVGTFHVLDYSGPHVIHRLGHAKPEWVAGWILALLTVHDTRRGKALCSVRIHVKNDVSDTPLSRRRRSDLTDSLTTKLGRRLRAEAPAALASISHVLSTEAPRIALAP